MIQRSVRLSVVLILAAAVAGSALILLMPAIVDPARTVQPWLPVLLAVIFLGCALTARAVRPDRGPRR